MTGYLTAWVFEGKDASSPGYSKLRIDFGDGAPAVEAQVAAFFARRLNLRVNEFVMARHDLEKAAKTQMISLHSKGHLDSTFRVPKLHEALIVMDDCVADLVATWGFSREQQSQISRPAKIIGSPNKYVSAFDYPTQALREDQSGENSAHFIIHADGTTDDCKIVESSRSHSLDSELCIVIRRMRFEPALDRAGRPTESMSFQRIRWQLF